MAQSLDELRQTVGRLAAAPSFDPEQAKRMAQSLDELRQTMGQLAAAQEQIGHEVTRLQAADQEILARIPSASTPSVPPLPPTRKPPSGGHQPPR
jgi:ABC-type transporter Mla subunit MlaD